jgi:hypothetical protein
MNPMAFERRPGSAQAVHPNRVQAITPPSEFGGQLLADIRPINLRDTPAINHENQYDR